MRKRDPNAVIDQFQDELRASIQDWSALITGQPAAIAKRATMDAFSRASVAFERFRSDWHIAAITRDASVFALSQERRVHAALTEAARAQLAPYTTVVLPKHPTLDQVSELLDPDGGNLSIKSIAAWQDLAGKHLADPWLSKVRGIAWAEMRVADAVIAIRNAASHQSTRSSGALQLALRNLSHPTHHAGLQLPVNGVSLAGLPAYLHGQATAGHQRVEVFHQKLHDLSQTLRVP